MFENLGRTLICLRERTGKSQAALARAAGVGKSQLSKYENGKELPKLDSLERVLIALGMGYFEFFRVLDIVDRNEPGAPALNQEEIEECFTRLTRGMFALHREIVVQQPLRKESNAAKHTRNGRDRSGGRPPGQSLAGLSGPARAAGGEGFVLSANPGRAKP